jgi:hypothetical protein
MLKCSTKHQISGNAALADSYLVEDLINGNGSHAHNKGKFWHVTLSFKILCYRLSSVLYGDTYCRSSCALDTLWISHFAFVEQRCAIVADLRPNFLSAIFYTMCNTNNEFIPKKWKFETYAF